VFGSPPTLRRSGGHNTVTVLHTTTPTTDRSITPVAHPVTTTPTPRRPSDQFVNRRELVQPASDVSVTVNTDADRVTGRLRHQSSGDTTPVRRTCGRHCHVQRHARSRTAASVYRVVCPRHRHHVHGSAQLGVDVTNEISNRSPAQRGHRSADPGVASARTVRYPVGSNRSLSQSPGRVRYLHPPTDEKPYRRSSTEEVIGALCTANPARDAPDGAGAAVTRSRVRPCAAREDEKRARRQLREEARRRYLPGTARTVAMRCAVRALRVEPHNRQ